MSVVLGTVPQSHKGGSCAHTCGFVLSQHHCSWPLRRRRCCPDRHYWRPNPRVRARRARRGGQPRSAGAPAAGANRPSARRCRGSSARRSIRTGGVSRRPPRNGKGRSMPKPPRKPGGENRPGDARGAQGQDRADDHRRRQGVHRSRPRRSRRKNRNRLLIHVHGGCYVSNPGEAGPARPP